MFYALRANLDVYCGVRKAEWLGNDNRKTMIKATTTGQTLPFKSGTALPSPSQAPVISSLHPSALCSGLLTDRFQQILWYLLEASGNTG